MRPIWSWYPASSPRSSLASPDSLRTVFLRPCNGSSSRRSRPFSRFSRRVSRFSRRVSRFSRRVSRFSRRVSRFSRRVSRFSRRVSRFSRRVSRFSRRVSRFREPTSPRSALIVSFCFRVRSSALRSRALARGGEACAARFDLRSAATFLRNATSSSFCSCERSSALRSRAFSLDSGPVVSFLAAGAGAALSGRGPPPGGARSHSSGPAMPARLRATGRLPCAAT